MMISLVLPRPGEVVGLSRSASPQFGSRPITMRVTRSEEAGTTRGWCWLSGYELDSRGLACERRTVFVRLAGLVRIAT